MQIVNAIGADAVEQRVLQLARHLRAELLGLGCKLISPKNPEAHSGITVFRLFDDPKKDQDVLRQLLDERILISIRYTSGLGGMRVSTHYFNNEDDLAALCTCLKRIQKSELCVR